MLFYLLSCIRTLQNRQQLSFVEPIDVYFCDHRSNPVPEILPWVTLGTSGAGC